MFKKLLDWWGSRGQHPVRYPKHGTAYLPSGDDKPGILPPTRFSSGAAREFYAGEVVRAMATRKPDQPAEGEPGGSSSRGQDAWTKLSFGQTKRGVPSTFMIISPEGSGESVLSKFSEAELGEMLRWAQAQKGAGKGVTLASWPDWQDACLRMRLDAGSAREISEALLARLRATGAL